MTTNDSGQDMHHFQSLRLHCDDWGRLILTDAQGETHVDVEPVRAFPLSNPGGPISIRDCQTHRELIMIPDISLLSQEMSRTLQSELAQREFMPHIQRIRKIQDCDNGSEWSVDTDRGPCQFRLNSDGHLRRLSEHRHLVIDNVGVRFLIDDARKLDVRSRHFLEQFLC